MRQRRRRLAAVTAIVAAAVTALPALASAATISGTVTEAAGAQAPLEGVRVCANQQNFQLESWCADTDSAGNYTLSVAAGEYSVRFDDSTRNRNVVSQFYGSASAPGTLLNLPGAGDSLTGIDAQLQPGSTIAGTVTDAVTHAGLASILVCAEVQLPFESGRCERSGSGGAYEINGIAPGKVSVRFESPFNPGIQARELNYQSQRYAGTPVEILGPGETFSAIDAAMQVGVELSGRLTEAGTGLPAAHVDVDLYWLSREESFGLVTDANGSYVLRGLPEADYVLLFSRPNGPLGADVDCFAKQYYGGSSTLAGATVLHGVPGVAQTGLDAQLLNICPQVSSPPPLQVTFAPATPAVGVNSPLHCRKGFHRKRVKGKARCVKRHRRHHRRHHRGG